MRGTQSRIVSVAGRNWFIPAFAGNTPPRPFFPRPTAVHPRVCGEHCGKKKRPALTVGSSPRLRGTRTLCNPLHAQRRFIPAFAGNTQSSESKIVEQAVHPRVCGEHAFTFRKLSVSEGSSPRLRGTLPRSDGDLNVRRVHPRVCGEHVKCSHLFSLKFRFIPAFAGNTHTRPTAFRPLPVHPRVCGEHGSDCLFGHADVGSSPRLRGTLGHGIRHSLRGRFIPAFAGNTEYLYGHFWYRSVHPRVCGEHALLIVLPATGYGSSPRLRGTHPPYLLFGFLLRFIPAFAGNTQGRGDGAWRRWVHPRVCGEHLSDFQRNRLVRGSSPRLRGTRRRDPRAEGQGRFIPAFAGNTPISTNAPTITGVHPRVCGEHASLASLVMSVSGSSPRLRGTRGDSESLFCRFRFIPAFAGNTYSPGLESPVLPVHPRVCGEHFRDSKRVFAFVGSSPRLRGTRI